MASRVVRTRVMFRGRSMFRDSNQQKMLDPGTCLTSESQQNECLTAVSLPAESVAPGGSLDDRQTPDRDADM